MEHGVEGRRLHRDGIARPGHRLQAEVDGLGRADGDDHLVRIDGVAVLQVAARDLPDQLGAAGRQVVEHGPLGIAARDVVGVLVDALPRKQRRVRIGRTERHGIIGTDRAQRGKHQRADVHRRGLGTGPGRAQLEHRLARPRAHKVAGLRPAFDDAAALQQDVGPDHRGDAHAVVLAGLPHRGNPLAGQQHALLHQCLDVRSQFFI